MELENGVKYITHKELAEALQVDRATIYNWRDQGLPYYKLGPHDKSPVRYRLDEVQAWIVQRMVRVTKGE